MSNPWDAGLVAEGKNMHSNNGLEPFWCNEKDWLVEVVAMDIEEDFA
jgi:hypothetical protein